MKIDSGLLFFGRGRFLKDHWVVGLGILLFVMGTEVCRTEDHYSSREGAGLEKMIVGGKQAREGAYPWMAALLHSHDPIPYRGFFAGATLIHPEWLLTAAHVVEGKSPEEIDVLLGGGDLLGSQAAQRRSIVSIVRHPRFGNEGRRLGADLALLRLGAPVNEVPTLAFGSVRPSVRPGAMTRTMGWGTTSTRGFRASSLRTVDIPVIPSAAVDAKQIYGEEIPSDVVLAGDPGGMRDTCDGDSGGPLLQWDHNVEAWKVIAVVAGGADVGCAVQGTYGLYTLVGPHMAWIEATVVRKYSDWAHIHRVGSAAADPDGDGFSNWDEYAYSTWPLHSASRPRLVSGIQRVAGMSYPALSARGRSGVEDLGYRVEVSFDLNRWKSLASLTASKLPVNQEGEGMIRWRSPLSLNEAATQFFRLVGIRLETRSVLETEVTSSTVAVASR